MCTAFYRQVRAHSFHLPIMGIASKRRARAKVWVEWTYARCRTLWFGWRRQRCLLVEDSITIFHRMAMCTWHKGLDMACTRLNCVLGIVMRSWARVLWLLFSLRRFYSLRYRSGKYDLISYFDRSDRIFPSWANRTNTVDTPIQRLRNTTSFSPALHTPSHHTTPHSWYGLLWFCGFINSPFFSAITTLTTDWEQDKFSLVLEPFMKLVFHWWRHFHIANIDMN